MKCECCLSTTGPFVLDESILCADAEQCISSLNRLTEVQTD